MCKSVSTLFTMCFYCLLVPCPSLPDPSNGMMNCSLGDDEVPSSGDTCSFTCDTGYELTGSDTRTCQSDGSWSGSIAMCSRGEWFFMQQCCIKSVTALVAHCRHVPYLLV